MEKAISYPTTPQDKVALEKLFEVYRASAKRAITDLPDF